ncbi:unnamed protein product, partial [Rotaria sp. Silwood1]
MAPIHICAAADHDDLLEILFKHNADINLLDGQGQTSLHHAVKNGHLNACRFLITHKIDTSIVSSYGQTALDMASASNIQQLLMTYENEKVILTPNITDLQLQLLEASKSGDLDVVKRVLTFNPSLV